MSDEDFKERLERIAAKSPHTQRVGSAAAVTGQPRLQKPRYHVVGAGGAIMSFGIQGIKYTHKNYDAIRDSGGVATAVGLGLAGIVLMVLGIYVIVRGCANRVAASDTSPYATNAGQPMRQPSNWARVLFSLLGFAFGAIASFYMFVAAAARFVGTAKALHYSHGAQITVLTFTIVALLFGLCGIFLRGFALGRVPVYFVFGAVLTFAAVRLLRVNILDWPQFWPHVQ